MNREVQQPQQPMEPSTEDSVPRGRNPLIETNVMDVSIRLNNYGCALFSSGRLQHGYDLFAGALQTFYLYRERLSQGTMSDMFLIDPSIQRALDILGCYGFTDGMGIVLKPVSPSTVGTEASTTDESTIFIRWEPFLIQEPCTSTTASSIFVMATLLFNNALVLHRNVVKNTNRPIQRAITLYSMATEAMFRSPLLEYLATNRNVSLLAMTILNNFGYALHQTNDYESSRLCFSTLDSILQQLGPPLTDQERDQRTIFASNVFLFYQSGPIPSAAAA